MLRVHTIQPARKSKRRKKRVGRGNASGHGTYSTRGIKGQRSRSGGKGGLKRLGFRRTLVKIPKNRGFKSFKPSNQVVSLKDLDKYFKNGDSVDPKLLFQCGLIGKTKTPVKILANGKITKVLNIKNCLVSKTARSAIEKAGGSVE